MKYFFFTQVNECLFLSVKPYQWYMTEIPWEKQKSSQMQDRVKKSREN